MRILPGTGFLIGDTPLIRLDRFAARHGCFAEIFLKLEYFNPASSTKDRVAKVILEEAEKKGKIKPFSNPPYTLVEATSGNLGVSLASLAAQKGYKIILTSPDNLDQARQNQLRTMGAQLVLTPQAAGIAGALKEAAEIVKKTPYSYLTGQYTSNISALAHYKNTGPEIWHQCSGQVDVFVSGVGSGGTISGVGRYFKERSKTVKVVGFELEGCYHAESKSLNRNYIDDMLKVSQQEAIATARELIREEGVFCGISTGANLCAAVQLAQKPALRNRRLVCLAADRAENYLCSPLFSN